MDPAFLAPAGEAMEGLTPGGVARALRRARARQGLSVKDVSARTGIPLDQLRAVENGAFHLPDQLAALKTVRRYADYLGLPGDRYALALLEQWPTRGAAGPSGWPAAAGVAGAGGAPAAVTRGAPGRGDPATAEVQAVGTQPLDTQAHALDTQAHDGHAGEAPTGLVTAVGTAGAPTAGAPTAAVPMLGVAPHGASTATPAGGYAGYAAYGLEDTGVTPAVRGPVGARQGRPARRGAPRGLVALVVVLLLAVVAGVAVLAIDRLHPSWLRTIGILAKHPGPPVPTAGASTGAGSPSHTGTSAAGGGAAAATGSHTTTPPSGTAATGGATGAKTATGKAGGHGGLVPVRANATTVVYTVPAPSFTVRVSAVGPCWVDVTSTTSPQPLFAGMLYAGQSRTFAKVHDLAVQMGSSAGRLSVTAGRRHLLVTAVPKVAPVTSRLQSAAH